MIWAKPGSMPKIEVVIDGDEDRMSSPRRPGRHPRARRVGWFGRV